MSARDALRAEQAQEVSQNGAGPAAEPERPAPPRAEAFYGLPGEITRAIEPHTESDPVAILAQVLLLAGSVMGPTPRFRVEGDTHGTNLFAVCVGETSRGRKGTSRKQAETPIRLADPVWADECKPSGLSSGEGVIFAVRDASMKIVDGEPQVADQGVDDKRVAIVETEFSSTLRVMGREGSTLSAVLRNAWDCDDLRVLTRNSPLRATGAHISVIGHITAEELRRELSTTDAANGFANRFLFFSVYRSKLLPEGGEAHRIDWQPTVDALTTAFDDARSLTEPIRRNVETRERWAAIYPVLTADHPGMLGAITSRGEAQVTRLSLIYAVLDRSKVITPEHLDAAMALWEYSERSCTHIFGDALGDPVADDILRALRRAGEAGLTRTQIRDLFGRHKQADRIDRALAVLHGLGFAQMAKQETGGRPVEVWTASR
jgi:Protein of unknown function (DUF3987)